MPAPTRRLGMSPTGAPAGTDCGGATTSSMAPPSVDSPTGADMMNILKTGKAVREDARKTTFVSFSGVEGARELAAELCQTADRALAPFGTSADRLRELSAFVAARRL